MPKQPIYLTFHCKSVHLPFQNSEYIEFSNQTLNLMYYKESEHLNKEPL